MSSQAIQYEEEDAPSEPIDEVPEWLRSPIDLPERQAGRYSITHAMTTKLMVTGTRETLLTGREHEYLHMTRPVRIHRLYEDGRGVWMSDLPSEIRQAREAVDKMNPRGRVLVGGLGLGIIAKMLAEEEYVTGVDVIEISPEIVSLTNPKHPKVNVVTSDVYEFLRQTPEWVWDCAYFDTWQGTSEGDWWGDVFPLRRIIQNRFHDNDDARRVLCWAEDIMLGQVWRRLLTLQAERAHWFYREALDLPMTATRARSFLRRIGDPWWERKYGASYPWSDFDRTESEGDDDGDDNK